MYEYEEDDYGSWWEPDDFETYNQNEADDYRHENYKEVENDEEYEKEYDRIKGEFLNHLSKNLEGK